MTPYNVTNAPELCFNLTTRMTNEYHSYEIFDNFAKNGFYSNAEFSQYFCQKMSCTLYKHGMLQNSSRTWVLGNTCGIWNNLCGPSMPHIKKWIFCSPVMNKGVLLSGKWLSRQGFVAYVLAISLRTLISLPLTHCGLVTSYGEISSVIIGSDTCLLPDRNKTLPEPMLTNHQWDLKAFTWGKFHGKLSRCLSLI